MLDSGLRLLRGYTITKALFGKNWDKWKTSDKTRQKLRA